MKIAASISALCLFAACSSSSSGTTGGACAQQAQSCAGGEACCTGLSCSLTVGLCLVESSNNGSGSSSGNGVSTTAASGATSSSGHSASTSGNLTGTTGPGHTSSTSGAVSGISSSTTGSCAVNGDPCQGNSDCCSRECLSNVCSSETFSAATSGSGSFGSTGSIGSTGSFGGTTGHSFGTTGTSNGTATGGTTGSSVYAGGCTALSYFSTEFGNCGDGGVSCICGQACLSDDISGLSGAGGYCETPCTSSSQCPDLDTACIGGKCTLDTCTSIYTGCGSDGECLPFDFTGAGPQLNYCVVSGTVPFGGVCQSEGFANDPSGNCADGQICLSDAEGATTGLCYEACDSSGGAGPTCPSPSTCASLDTDVPAIGYCTDGGF